MTSGKTFINSGDKTVQNEIRSLIEILEIGADPFIPVANGGTLVDLEPPPAEAATGRTRRGSLKIFGGETTASPTSAMTPAANLRQPSRERSGQFSCQFCQKGFEDFSDLSKHVQLHFLEPEGRTRTEERPPSNPRVKTEPEDSYSGPQIVSVQSLQPAEESSLPQDSNSNGQVNPMATTKAQSSLLYLPGTPVEKKPRLVATAPSKASPKSSKPSEANEGEDGEGSNVQDDQKPKVKCPMCKLSISNIPIQIERHLSISHFAQNLSNEFGHSKVDCPRCRKRLKTRRGFLTHVFSRHSSLPQTFADVKAALDNKEISMMGSRGKPGRKPNLQWKLEENKFPADVGADKMACPYCPQTTTNNHAMVSHVCHAHFNKVSHLLMPNAVEQSTCGLCKRQFGTFGALTYHLATAHHLLDNVLKSSGTTRHPGKVLSRKTRRKNKLRYYCPECPVQIDSYFALIAHLGHIHFKEVILSHSKPGSDHTCKFCDRAFSNLGPLAYLLVAAHQVLKAQIPSKDQLLKPRTKLEKRD